MTTRTTPRTAELLATRRARRATLRRRSVAAVLSTFVLAFGVVSAESSTSTGATAAASSTATRTTASGASLSGTADTAGSESTAESEVTGSATTTEQETTTGSTDTDAGEAELPAASTSQS